MRRLTGIVTLVGLLSLPVCAQGHSTPEIVELRIEAVATNREYDRNSSIPIRCHFKNTSDKPISLALPGLGSQRMGLATLGLEVSLKRENEKKSLFQGRADFRSEFCRSMREKMDSEVECDSSRDAIDLQPHQEFVRTVHLSTLLWGLGKSGRKMQPGKYIVQIKSSQTDGILVSNELAIQVKP